MNSKKPYRNHKSFGARRADAPRDASRRLRHLTLQAYRIDVSRTKALKLRQHISHSNSDIETETQKLRQHTPHTNSEVEMLCFEAKSRSGKRKMDADHKYGHYKTGAKINRFNLNTVIKSFKWSPVC